jgi:hypothetical protein
LGPGFFMLQKTRLVALVIRNRERLE